MGKRGSNSRPIKVIFSDMKTARLCLRNKQKLQGTNLNIGPDLTIS